MNCVNINVKDLVFKENTRLQCLHGCENYMNNPFCPPFIKNVEWFKNLINSYENAKICYSGCICENKHELKSKKNKFHDEILGLEYELKKNGRTFAISFISGACTKCEDEKCRKEKCNRYNVGRIPICATGISLDYLLDIINIKDVNLIDFWKNNTINRNNGNVFFISIIFY